MATKARFPYVNRFAGTMSASSAATGYPVTNLTSTAPWKLWRSSNATADQWVKVQRSESSGITCALLKNWRAFSGGTIKVQFNSSDSWAAPAFEATFTLPAANPTKVIALWFAARTETWIRFLFTYGGGGSNYVEAGIAFVGSYFEPTVSLADGVRFTRVDPSQVRQAIGGQRSVVSRQKFYAVDADFQFVSAADEASFQTMFDTVGTVTPLFFAVDGDDADQIVYGHMAEELRLEHAFLDRWNIGVAFEEAR